MEGFLNRVGSSQVLAYKLIDGWDFLKKTHQWLRISYG